MTTADAQTLLAEAGAPPISDEELGRWMLAQRWFGAKARAMGTVSVLDAVRLPDPGDPLFLLVVEVQTPAGTHDLYQLPVGIAAASDTTGATIAEADGRVLYDALTDEQQTARLGQLIANDAVVITGATTVRFSRSDDAVTLSPTPTARRIASEQSNSSVILDNTYILKAFRRIEAGINPELEMLSFLSRHGFEHIAPVDGWYSYSGARLDTTLGVMQRFIPDAHDGWELVLETLARGGGDELIEPLRELGAITAQMHVTLAADSEDAEFAPESPSDEHVALMAATIDEQIDRSFMEMPDRDVLEPIRGRATELRDLLSALSHTGIGGRLIRAHGDYHLGQTLRAQDRWIVLDFEGEPGRPLRERRRKRSPLRDVAGMLRSLAYAGLAGELLRGGPRPPADWEGRARASFLDGYMADIDDALLPAGTQAIDKQLAMFELEKLLYELRYELENRPSWLIVPVSGIQRLLAESLP